MPRINTEADALPYVQRIKRWMALNGFDGLGNVRVVIRDPGCAGRTYLGRNMVYIKPGYGVMYFCEILVHELAHHWLYKRSHEATGFSGEGAAEWVAYQFLTAMNTPESLAHAALLTSHPVANNIDYSQALEAMLRRAS